MLFFHGVREAVNHPSVKVDVTISQPSKSVIEIIGRVQGDFAEHRAYLLYILFCEHQIKHGKPDDRKLNPDDLINRILPQVSFHYAEEDDRNSIGGLDDSNHSSINSERALIIKFSGILPDDPYWECESSYHGNHIVFTKSKPHNVEPFDLAR